MQLYRVIDGPLSIGQGEVAALTPAQQAPRAHALEVTGLLGDRVAVRVTEPIQLKTGEVVGLESIPTKAMRERLDALVEPVGAPAAPPAPKAKRTPPTDQG